MTAQNNFVGVDIGGTKMHMLAVHNGAYIDQRVPTGRGCTAEELQSHIDTFIAGLPFTPSGIGMAVPGLVENDNKIIVSNPLPKLAGVDNTFFSRNKYPVAFLNDVAAATVAEAAHHKDAHTVLVILVGTYIGMGVCVNGELLLGSRGWGNDLGYHVINTSQGVQRVNDICGGAAILQQAACDASTLTEKLQKSDEEARKIIKSAATFFGYALSNALHLYNPDVVVIGGGTAMYDGYTETALAAAKQQTLTPHFECCTFTAPHDPVRVGALGAMTFAAQKYSV